MYIIISLNEYIILLIFYYIYNISFPYCIIIVLLLYLLINHYIVTICDTTI